MMYLIRIDYFATGEGRHIWQGLVVANDEESAKLKFRNAFSADFDNQSSWDWWSAGLSIKLIENELDESDFVFLNPKFVDAINSGLKCYPELYFKYDVNCS